MQHIATAKSELAALLTKVNGHASNNFNQPTDFQSYFKQADQVYSKPVEPPRSYVDKSNDKRTDNAPESEENQRDRNKTLQDKSKDNQPEFAKPAEQKSAVLASEKDNAEKSSSLNNSEPKAQRSDKVEIADSENNIDEKSVANRNDFSDKKQLDKDAQKTKDNLDLLAQQPKEREKANTTENPEQSVELNGLLATHIMVDNDTTEDVITDETALIDWLGLVEKSIAKATEGDNSQSESEDNPPEFSITDMLLANNTDDNTTESDSALSSTQLEDNELEKIDINLLATDNQQIVESPVTYILDKDVTADVLTVSEATTTLNKLFAELQAVLNIQQQEASSDTDASLEQLLNQITDVIGKVDPQATGQLRESLRLETIASDLIQSKDLEAVTETDVAIDNDLRLMIDLLMTAATNNNKATDVAGNDTKQVTGLSAKGFELKSSDVELVNTTAMTLDKTIATLVELPAENIDVALTNLAHRLDLKSATKQVGISEADIKSDFVSALKSGVEEIKAQIKQGHQPAIDLSSLVNDAAAKVNLVPVVPEVLDQTITRFNQTLEMTSQLTAKVEQLQVATISEKALVRENNSQAQHLQTKQGQQLAQFDKAVNINRQEGLQQLTEKVRWMVNQNNLQADIRLDPPELGAVKVRLNMSGDTASVNIVVQSQQARDVLEQATPRLKELLEQQGIELGQSSVEQEQSGDSEQQGSQFVGTGDPDDNLQGDDSEVLEQRISNGRIGGIDYFV